MSLTAYKSWVSRCNIADKYSFRVLSPLSNNVLRYLPAYWKPNGYCAVKIGDWDTDACVRRRWIEYRLQIKGFYLFLPLSPTSCDLADLHNATYCHSSLSAPRLHSFGMTKSSKDKRPTTSSGIHLLGALGWPTFNAAIIYNFIFIRGLVVNVSSYAERSMAFLNNRRKLSICHRYPAGRQATVNPARARRVLLNASGS